MHTKLSMELPNSLLKYNYVNDYDYILFHLLENKQYANYYLQSKNPSIFDNSAFEYNINKKHFDIEQFIWWINKLNPTEIIIPDKLGDGEATRGMFNQWWADYDLKVPKHIKRIAVVQGDSFDDWLNTYRYYKKFDSTTNRLNKIAVSFGYPWLEQFGWGTTKCQKFGNGRSILLKWLVDNKFIFKPVHLLGCYDLMEYASYSDYKFIESVDTSLPIKLGIMGIQYDPKTLYEKPEVILDDFIDAQFTKSQESLIYNNMLKFKTWAGIKC